MILQLQEFGLQRLLVTFSFREKKSEWKYTVILTLYFCGLQLTSLFVFVLSFVIIRSVTIASAYFSCIQCYTHHKYMYLITIARTISLLFCCVYRCVVGCVSFCGCVRHQYACFMYFYVKNKQSQSPLSSITRTFTQYGTVK